MPKRLFGRAGRRSTRHVSEFLAAYGYGLIGPEADGRAAKLLGHGGAEPLRLLVILFGIWVDECRRAAPRGGRKFDGVGFFRLERNEVGGIKNREGQSFGVGEWPRLAAAA